ncbi:MAG TPA: hypothetical protein GXX47_04280 [Firmicutes bacterium]|nr:hypothetical protein [Bacillota bacterium]
MRGVVQQGGGKASPILLISNGYGEDLLAGVLAQALHRQRPELEVWAFPVVGEGRALQRFPVKIVGVQEEMPSGGWVRQSWKALREDIRAGFLQLTWRQWQALKALRARVSFTVPVGDIYALFLAYRFVRRPIVFVPTAKSDYIRGHLALEKHLMKKYCRLVLPRDELTAEGLRRSGIPAKYVGNLMMDAIFPSGERLYGTEERKWVIGILPGSRNEAYLNLPLLSLAMDTIVEELPDAYFAVALAGNLSLEKAAEILIQNDWQPEAGAPHRERERFLAKNRACLLLAQGRFGDILAASRVVLGLAGTANEQAAGLGKPVVAFPGPGSQFTKRFLAAQKRLLGDALEAAEGPIPAGQAVLSILADEEKYRRMAACGRRRMGEPGGAERMAAEILQLWDREMEQR